MAQQQSSRSVQSNAEGYYTFVALPPGSYEISFEAQGFKKQVRSGVELTVNQNVRLDAALEIGSVDTQVSVEASAPLVDTVTPTLSGLVDDRRVVDLPLNGRNVISLARIIPGVLGVSAPQQLDDARSGPVMNVNGGRSNMNLFTFNGGFFNNPSRNTGMNFPPPDAIQEFRILTHNFAPEYGHNPGSQVTVVSKAGTNEIHGSAWEFLRNDALNARNFFSPRVPALRQNQFGGALGGPVKKDKLFIFGSYQGLRDHREAQTVQAFVPSAAERSGDFTHSASPLSNPVDTLTGKPMTDGSGAPCVAGNRVSAGCISPVTKKLLGYIPESPTGSIVSLSGSPRQDDLFIVRGDYNLSSRHRIFGHFFYDHNSRSNPFSGGNVPDWLSESFSMDGRHVVVNDTYTFTPTLLNQATFSWLRSDSGEFQNQTRPPSDLGINMPMYTPTGTTSFDVASGFTLGGGPTTYFWSQNWQFRDNVSWIRGRHQIKAGYEMLKLQFRQAWIWYPTFSFTGDYTGDANADFLLGKFNSLSLNFGVRDTDSLTTSHSFFVQDEFKVHPRLTLTYGLRYEPFLPWVDRNDRINTFQYGKQSKVVPDAPPGLLFPGDVPRGLANSDLNNFAPRFGFAWDVTGNGKTAVRGGYGLFYESINADSLAQENPPFAGNSNIYSGRLENPYGSLGMTPPPAQTSAKFGCTKTAAYPGYDCPLFPLPLFGLFTGSTLRSPYVQSFNLSVQRQVTSGLMIESAYAGKIGIKLPALLPFNPARFVNSARDGSAPSDQNVEDRVAYYPGIISASSQLLGNDFRSWYHSWQTQVNKRFGGGLSLVASYALSKSLDTSSTSNLGGNVANPFNLRDERGRSSWDRRHAFVASWLWQLPVKFQSRAVDSLLGGWTLTGITSIQSGAPLTFVMGSDVALDGTGGGNYQHAVLAPNATVKDIGLSHTSRDAMIRQFFNTAAFVPPRNVARGTYGNAGRGLISGPASNTTDLAALKDFALREKWKLQFRSEFFNALNQVSLGNPNQRANASSFGRITSAGSGRVIQFALKMLW